MKEIVNSQHMMSLVVVHYIRDYFMPRKVTGKLRLSYIYENALHLNLGKNVDYINFALYLAQNYPYTGVLIRDRVTYKILRRMAATDNVKIPSNVQFLISKLPKNMNLFIILNASKFSNNKLNRAINHWTSEKPLILLG